MKKSLLAVGLMGLCLLAVLATGPFGCDTASGLAGMTITPSYVVLTVASNSVWLSAGGVQSNNLALPLEWSVQTPQFGFIAEHSGWNALYFRHAVDGDNIVTVRDQYGNEGYATVRQIRGEAVLTVDKLRADEDTWTLSVRNPSSGSYEWWVHNPALGTISTTGNGSSAVYEVAESNAINDVYVRDASGNMGSATIP